MHIFSGFFYTFLTSIGFFVCLSIVLHSAELRVQHDNDLPAVAIPITDEDVYRLVKPEPAELTQENLEQINQLGFDMTLPTQVMDFIAKEDEIVKNSDFILPTRVIIPVVKKVEEEPHLEPPVQDHVLPSSMIPGKKEAEVFYVEGEEPISMETVDLNKAEVKPAAAPPPPPKQEPKKKKKKKRKKRR